MVQENLSEMTAARRADLLREAYGEVACRQDTVLADIANLKDRISFLEEQMARFAIPVTAKH